jgi:hypothetical protein
MTVDQAARLARLLRVNRPCCDRAACPECRFVVGVGVQVHAAQERVVWAEVSDHRFSQVGDLRAYSE